MDASTLPRPSLGTREVLAFGPGVALPTRFKFPLLPPEQVPRSEAVSRGRLTADLASDALTQEVTFAFSKGPVHYSDFRRDVSALMEQMGEQSDLLHISFWPVVALYLVFGVVHMVWGGIEWRGLL